MLKKMSKITEMEVGGIYKGRKHRISQGTTETSKMNKKYVLVKRDLCLFFA